MQTVERSALVTFSPAQMYALVDDVERYPEFLPWCTGARVEESSSTEKVAAVQVARGILKTEFTTRNALSPDSRIDMRLVRGPFSDLNGVWLFEPIGVRGTRISFRVEFEFKSRVSAAAFNAVFESMCGTIVDAFVQRARTIYA